MSEESKRVSAMTPAANHSWLTEHAAEHDLTMGKLLNLICAEYARQHGYEWVEPNSHGDSSRIKWMQKDDKD